jgi:predicted dehydrogenase
MDSPKKDTLNRRQFLGRTAKVAAGALTISAAAKAIAEEKTTGKKVNVALVGTGHRGTSTWGKNLVHEYKEHVEMVAICDINPKRLEVGKRLIETDAPTYLEKDFDRMIAETKPDAVIVCTPDCFHYKYAIRAMELGCDAIVEKPLATTAEQCQQLIDAERKTGKKITTTFNARHGDSAEQVKKILMDDTLGRIISAEFAEYLDINHGASYYRRWHGKIRYSGSLLVHKASHHFDQMNWWLDAEPKEVHAFGKLAFYGHNNSFRHRNCRGCPYKDNCAFYFDITKDQRMMDLYVSCEDADGYLRDGCLWANDIDTYDTMTVEVKYNNGVLLSYSLNTFMPYEGQRIAFNGEKGRLDVRNYARQSWDVGDTKAEFRLTESFKESKTWQIKKANEPTAEFSHGGADFGLKDLIFRPNLPDPLDQLAGSRAGVMSSLIGIAARKSIQTGQRIKIADLIDFPLAWGWT